MEQVFPFAKFEQRINLHVLREKKEKENRLYQQFEWKKERKKKSQILQVSKLCPQLLGDLGCCELLATTMGAHWADPAVQGACLRAVTFFMAFKRVFLFLCISSFLFFLFLFFRLSPLIIFFSLSYFILGESQSLKIFPYPIVVFISLCFQFPFAVFPFPSVCHSASSVVNASPPCRCTAWPGDAKPIMRSSRAQASAKCSSRS